MNANKWIAYTDGASRGNPGPAAAGVYVMAPDGQEYTYKKYLGEQTNNYAEYQAMILALKALIKVGAKEVVLRADSQLMVKQMLGEYRVKNENIKPLFQEASKLVGEFDDLDFEYVPRAENKKADGLANQALDEEL